MKTQDLKVGMKMESYYGNGVLIGIKTIARMTDASIFFDSGQRESINTVNNSINDGLYKVI